MKSFQIFLFIFSFFYCSQSFSQIRKVAVFGEPFREEFAMTTYAPDPEAAAVVLFESGKNFVEVVDNYTRLIKEVHRKIKVFDAKRFEQSSIGIPYYREKNIWEKVAKIKALTHNGAVKTYVSDDAIFTTDESQNWSLKRFTFPNVKDGSILEYTYRIESPYFGNFGGWEFQGDLPKIYSEFNSSIPGNFRYNRILHGNLKLDINEAKIKRNCLSLDGFAVPADCEVAVYAMNNVPAFKAEPYMLSRNNYLSKLTYELVDLTDFQGDKQRYTQDWENVDNYLKDDKDFGRQRNHTSYFEGQLPAKLLTIPDPLEKAKGIYYYLQDRMAWNGYYRIFSDIRVKDAFEAKSGNNSEINIALLNALEAGGFEPKLMLLSTRENGHPTLDYPVITDFNATIVLLSVAGTEYLLDATEKSVPFGQLPFRDLNIQGRVMDFKKGSYWMPIEPYPKNTQYGNVQLNVQDDGSFSGIVNETFTGYVAVELREKLRKHALGEFLKPKRKANREITDFTIENQNDLENPLKTTYQIQIETETVGDKTVLNPFIVEPYFTENPFTSKKRNYPIDFGFPINLTQLVTIDLNGKYSVESLPANKHLKLPNNDGEVSVVFSQSGSKINVRLSARLNRYSFPADAAAGLQEFFATMIDAQNNGAIVLKRL